MGKSGKSKSGKSKKSKQPKEDIIVEPEDEVVDIDVPESEGEDGDQYAEKEIEETEGVEVDEKGETLESAAPAEKKSFASYFQFSKAEMPLLGYTFAAFVFFLAAVGKRCDYGRRRLDDTSFIDAIFDAASDAALNDFDLDDDLGLGLGFIGSGPIMRGMGICLRNSYYAYALCFGIFGVLMGGGELGWKKYKANQTNAERPFGGDLEDGSAEGTVEEEPNTTMTLVMNGFLFAWAVAGWAVFTFAGDGVFSMTGNGFFALWAMMLFSIWNMGFTAASIADQAKNSDTWIHAMSFASIVTIVELTAGYVWKYHPYKNISSYGLSVATISLVFGLVIIVFSFIGNENTKLDPKIRMYTIGGLLVLWIVAACLTTFIGPFLVTGNGYFAVWGAVIAAGMAFANVQGEVQA